MTVIKRYRLRLTLEGPLLSHGSGAQSFGRDTMMLRYRDQPVLNGSAVRGNLRHALARFADLLEGAAPNAGEDRVCREDIERWFGPDSDHGKLSPDAAAIAFDFFWRLEDVVAAPRRDRHRIRVDDATGLTESGSLHVIEDRFGSGATVRFSGSVVGRYADEADARRCERWLRKALAYVPALGALKGVGFGRLLDAELIEEATPTRSAPPPLPDDTSRLGFVLTMDRPFCVGKPRTPDSNRIVSEERIPGNVLKAVVARMSGGDSEYLERWHFDELVFRDALPAREGSPGRVAPLPLSIAAFGERVRDLALEKRPCVLRLATDPPEWRAPAFAADWKPDQREAVGALVEAPPSPERYLSVRTGIDRDTGAAATSKLFSLDCVDPHGFVWCGEIELNAIAEQGRPAIYRWLTELLSDGLTGIGKTRASAKVELVPGGFAPPALPGPDTPRYVVHLVSPARLLPAELSGVHGCNGDARLARYYADYWSGASGGAMGLSHYFARQTIVGGAFYHEYYRRQATHAPREYRPEWLTEAGSVFVLEVHEPARAAELMGTWLGRGLPVAADREADDWCSDPFRPENGFGEIRLYGNEGLQRCQAEEGDTYEQL